ncbi:MAG: hypothetical protein PHP50_14130 [Lachnospiraceae bacterium]|nr:hypothetical protein [Lachnospiraceae bacterium]
MANKKATVSPGKLEQEKIKKEIKDKKKEYKKYLTDSKKVYKNRTKELKKKEKELKNTKIADFVWGLIMIMLIFAVWVFIMVVVLKFDIGGLGTKLTPVLDQIPNGYLLEP